MRGDVEWRTRSPRRAVKLALTAGVTRSPVAARGGTVAAASALTAGAGTSPVAAIAGAVTVASVPPAGMVTVRSPMSSRNGFGPKSPGPRSGCGTTVSPTSGGTSPRTSIARIEMTAVETDEMP
jgi:hypothetical protein